MKIEEKLKFYYPTNYVGFYINIDYDNPTLDRGKLFKPNRKATLIKTNKDYVLKLHQLKDKSKDLVEELKMLNQQEYNEIKKKVLILKELKKIF